MPFTGSFENEGIHELPRPYLEAGCFSSGPSNPAETAVERDLPADRLTPEPPPKVEPTFLLNRG